MVNRYLLSINHGLGLGPIGLVSGTFCCFQCFIMFSPNQPSHLSHSIARWRLVLTRFTLLYTPRKAWLVNDNGLSARDRCIYTKRNESVTFRAYRPASRVPTACTLLHFWQLAVVVGWRTWCMCVFSSLHLRAVAAHQRGQPPTLPSPTHWHRRPACIKGQLGPRTVLGLSAINRSRLNFKFSIPVECFLLNEYRYWLRRKAWIS